MSSFDQLSKRAKKLENRGQIDEAIKLYEQFLQDYPKNTRAKAALEKLRDSASRNGISAQQAFMKASQLIEQGAFPRVIELAKQLVESAPENAQVWNLLGFAYAKDQKPVEAEKCLRKAIELDKNFATAWVNIANLFSSQKKFALALQAFQNASYLQAQNANILNSCATVLMEMQRFDEAERFCVQAITNDPNLADAYHNLAVILYRNKKRAAAKQAFEKVAKLHPSSMSALSDFLYARAQICDWSLLAPEFQNVNAIGNPGNCVSPFSLLHFEDDPYAQKKRSENRAGELAVRDSFPQFRRPGSRPQKLKIGYFSADFHNHATLSLMMGLFGDHDKSRFEIHTYSYGGVTDGWRRAQLQKLVDKNWDVRGFSDREIVQHARDQGIDIAIDLKGYTQSGRPQLFAYRMAPIQINYVGYPGTLGADYIDYLIADHIIIPDEYKNAYSEKIIYMPHCYQPNDGGREFPENTQARTELGLPESGFVFCSFNANYKISPREFDIWMRLLKKVDGSVLWLFEGSEDAMLNLRKEAGNRGVDPARLVFAGFLPEEQHLARHKHADLFLDTFNVNAHTTASDALWTGLPLVTLPGKQFAARVAASVLKAANLPELIAKSEKEYEALALDLALHPEKTAAIKAKVKDNVKACPLFDTKSYTLDLERGYDAAYERYLRQQAPGDIDLVSQ
ncbi:tetratricopeptide repeat protein [Thalassospira sp. ER-Se-21-Dark]|uniref:O-linked N-acetylglucosamine transferase, SPINDLY family protein n=1 Tax=Thalassospira sp. ER-Se-21-Dark TaxID=2585190 RepID=UPI001B314317|nr:tetratricopeptide repeat protein [Thalassospira sp. ER-Se-21-Dark]